MWSLQRDFDQVVDACEDVWPRLRGARLFVTGGTGLIGRWMLETLRAADLRHGLDLQATLLTRSPAAFASKAPHLADHPGWRLVQGDVIDFVGPPGDFTHVIHGATDASAELNRTDPRRMFDTVVAGTRRALDFAAQQRAARVLMMSSGAVYGPQPWEVERVSEAWMGGPDCASPANAYAEGKRAAEMLCAIYGAQFGLDIVTARIFALLGPLLSLDIHFAAGNFIRDAIAGRPVVVESTGEACRSYLYLGDVTTWLWRLLLSANPGTIYNVGSEHWVSIRDLAKRVAAILGDGGFEVQGKRDSGWNPGRYAPDTSKARAELGLRETVGLDEAIRRTAIWNGWQQ